MITLTPRAAEQVRKSAEQADAARLALRIAVRQNHDDSMEYGIGFDEVKDDDMTFTCEGIEVTMAPEFGPLLKGTTIDFVEIEPGEHRLIVMNPNDPSYVPPREEQAGGSSG